ncbi:MAG TPA: phage portal protein [Pyrinomonadaceae bacterium]|jgi:lambda family phage portal protein|nr:phage portal protein [Pyrinomonadaceae bacterium]
MSEVVRERRSVAQKRRAAIKRTYAAAQFNRLTNDFVSQRTSANAELRRGLRTLRARSRELARNDDYMKKFLSMVVSNVIGPAGIKLQPRAEVSTGKPDERLNKAVAAAWSRWSHKEYASASGKLSWVDAQRYYQRVLARDGEVLCQFVEDSNPYGFSIKFIDVDWLDETYNLLLPNGNRILMSVEVDQYGRPVNYWLTPPSYDYLYPENGRARQRVAVPASEIIHDFLVLDDEEQTRGVPWAHTAMLRLHSLGQYEEAEIIAARVAACKGTYIIPPADDELAGEGEDALHPQIEESIEPGMSQELPPGYTVHDVNPLHPNANVAGFSKVILQGVAAGLDVDYVTLANDLAGVNFSSMRGGMIETRDVYRGLQTHAKEHFCRPVYLRWLRQAIFMGAIEGAHASDFARLDEPKFQPRGWDWVDPMKDVQATVMAINNGLDSRTDALAERGEDFEHVAQNLKAEADIAGEYGLNLSAGAPTKPSVKAEEGSEDEGGDGASHK